MENLRSPRIGWIGLVISILLVVSFTIASPRQVVAQVVATGADTFPFTVSIERYVAPTGQDVGDCTSPLTPCQTIQYAVNQASSGDTILVAKGNYSYNPQSDQCPFLLTRAVVCLLDKRLRIAGGYSVENWQYSLPNENPTIIDGQNSYRGVAVIGYKTATTHLEMKGFTIQNGLAQGPTYINPYEPGGMGGGMLVQHAAVTLEDLIFINNVARGANTQSGDGGGADGSAIRIESTPLNVTSTIKRVRFENNQSYGGTGPDRGGVAFGALFIYNSNVTIEDSTFENNIAIGGNSGGSGISRKNGLKADALGGAIGIEKGNEITIKRVMVNNNRTTGGNATSYGGGAYGGGILVEDTKFFLLTESIVKNNIAQAGNGTTAGNPGGGGIQSQNNQELWIEKTAILSNSSIGGDSTNSSLPAGPGAGGGFYVFSTRSDRIYRAMLKNVIVADNLAKQGEKGVQGPGNGGGGGFVVQGVQMDIINATIAANRLDPIQIVGQAFLVLPWTLSNGAIPSNVTLTNSIIADHQEGGQHTVAIAVAEGSELHLNRVLFAGNKKDTNADNIPFKAGVYSGLDTVLYRSSANFVSPSKPYYNYRIRIGSPAKDSGIIHPISEDFENDARPFDQGIDLGADEYWPFALNGQSRDQFIHISWESGSQFILGAVAYYEVTLSCESGASSPNEIPCGQRSMVGKVTSLDLSGLSNFKKYTFQVLAYDSAGQLIANSNTLTLFPTDTLVYLPLVVK